MAQLQAVVFVDDVPSLIEAAQAFGMHGVVYVHNAQTIAALEALLVQ